ncbi:hypothetical protein PPSIR1_19619 [Plesiocystis pacifica SIR-1]|uniref:Uncharacterized protein n=1 Tax=Plesiocystis pacifica SIR-1 TaxID=391625 RepID=A6GAM3_9BACT|nr:hypothetical protein PPSIR1_19619 [Plesiocystis pacifica SIR-1]
MFAVTQKRHCVCAQVVVCAFTALVLALGGGCSTAVNVDGSTDGGDATGAAETDEGAGAGDEGTSGGTPNSGRPSGERVRAPEPVNGESDSGDGPDEETMTTGRVPVADPEEPNPVAANDHSAR